jgi:hypothetical protein
MWDYPPSLLQYTASILLAFALSLVIVGICTAWRVSARRRKLRNTIFGCNKSKRLKTDEATLRDQWLAAMSENAKTGIDKIVPVVNMDVYMMCPGESVEVPGDGSESAPQSQEVS